MSHVECCDDVDELWVGAAGAGERGVIVVAGAPSDIADLPANGLRRRWPASGEGQFQQFARGAEPELGKPLGVCVGEETISSIHDGAVDTERMPGSGQQTKQA